MPTGSTMRGLGPLALALTLIAALVVPAPATSAAQGSPAASPQASALPAAPIPDGASIIALLDAAISWYRTVDLEDQLVQEPAEVLLVSQDRSQAADILKFAFQYARAEAVALPTVQAAASGHPPSGAAGDILAHPDVIQSRSAAAEAGVANLRAQIQQLQKQIAAAPRARRADVSRQLVAAQSQLELESARAGFLATLSQFEANEDVHHANRSGTLLGQIDELERTVPQVAAGQTPSPAANGSDTKAASEPSGLVARAKAWFALRGKINLIGRRIQSSAHLNAIVQESRTALRQNLVKIDHDADALAGQGGFDVGDAAVIQARKKDFDALLARHKLLGDALLPLSEMSLLIARYQTNLAGWQQEVGRRASVELYGLALDAVGLAIVLGLMFAVGIAWRRVTFRYVEDSRRRSQMLHLRNVVIGVLVAIVIAFEFVSEVGSLATVIGLGTAGIAVALQDVIVSIAGYFRIGGRFGIKIGDWVELQGARGEVIDIGLTKLTMMELGGSGLTPEPTGRLLVMPNSVVFREKFANRAYDTSLGWDEIELTISPDCDYRLAEKRLLEAVEEVFAHYRDAARSESREMERRFHMRIETPRPHSLLKVGSDAIRLTVRYPVNARARARVADEISRRVLDSLKREPTIRLTPQSTGAIVQAGPAETSEPEERAAAESQPARAPLRKA